VEVDVELAKEAIYQRGLIINRYSAFEFSIAEVVSRASVHDAYRHLGNPPFGPAKKLKRLKQLIGLDGPIAQYRDDLLPKLEEFEQFEDHRHFMVHAIMVPRARECIDFKMYDHREGVYGVGELRFELQHLEKLAAMLSPVSLAFAELVSKICRDVPLPEV
jgi:hypothetical protein